MTAIEKPGSLGEVFLNTAAVYANRPALEVDGETYSYAALRERVLAVAATLQRHREDEWPALTAVLGARSLEGFAGILGILASGHGYVPILPSFPAGRVAVMLERSECHTLIVDADGAGLLAELLPLIERPLTLLCLAGEVDDELKTRWPRHTFLGPADVTGATAEEGVDATADDLAYLLFTSGSTGQPKGVMVNHGNILRFLDVVTARYDLGPEDRFSHMFDVTFDLSLFDMFAAWRVGGCLCCPNQRDRLLPAQYVARSRLSVWFSVPSTALLMKKTRTLTPDSFPDLRWSLFCGEALPVEVARAFAEAAPGSIVENLYGPTELTLACTQYRWREDSEAEAVENIVPIGDPYPGMTARVVNEDLSEVAPGEIGELTLTGPQLTPGYWQDAEKTAAAYVVPPGMDVTYYRTGDRVRRPEGDGPLIYLGRIDHQTKIRGYRVELGEVEAVLRREAGVDAAIVVGWPPAPGGAEGLVAFIDDASVDRADLRERMAKYLPSYMLPREVRVVDTFPLNPNGKIDRKALAATLQ